MDEKKLLLIGGGGHCKSVLDALNQQNAYSKIGIVDNSIEEKLLTCVVGTDDDLPELYKNGWTDAFVTVGSIGVNNTRQRLYNMLLDIGFNIPIIIDSSAIVSKQASISQGTFIGKRAVVNSGASVGYCSIINTSAIVEHDCRIDSFVHVSTGAVLCGEVTVGLGSHIGAGSVIRQCIRVGENVMIGAGSVVVNNIPSGVKAYGNPCRIRD